MLQPPTTSAKFLRHPYLKIFLICLAIAIGVEVRAWLMPFSTQLDHRVLGSLVLNGLVVFTAFALIHLLVPQKWTALSLLLPPLAVIVIADSMKRYYTTTPLMVSDFNRVLLALNVLVVYFRWSVLLALSAIFCLLFALTYFVARRETEATPLSHRAFLLVLGGFFLQLGYAPPGPVRNAVAEVAYNRTNHWSNRKMYEEAGLFFGLGLEWLKSRKPPADYDEAKVREWIARAPNPPPAPGVRPNVIIYLMESFNDPEDLAIKTNEDAIPFFHSLKKRYSSGYLLAPGVGGATGATEFEVLTGLRLDLYGMLASPFHTLSWPLPALPAQFRAYGYHTLSTHPESGNNYGRNEGHPMVGFDRSLFLPDYRGSKWMETAYIRITDEGVVDKIISESKAKPGPQLIFAITIAGHGPYDEMENLKPTSLKVINAPQPSEQRSLDNYVRLMRQSDEALRKLVTHYSRSPEPTVIMAFGDHAPPLGPAVFDAIPAHSLVTKTRAHSRSVVPVVLWSNFPRKKEKIAELTSTVGRLLHEAAGVPLALPFLAQEYLNEEYLKFREEPQFIPIAKIDRRDPVKIAGSRFHRSLHYFLTKNLVPVNRLPPRRVTAQTAPIRDTIRP